MSTKKLQILGSLTKQANWDQNDSTQPDYINGRTHWIDDPVVAEIFAEQTVDSFGSLGIPGFTQITGEWNVVGGTTYIVKYDGVEYECVAFDDGNEIMIGNRYLIVEDNPDTGEPFVLDFLDGTLAICVSDKTSTSHTVGVSELVASGEVHKLDPKFLPDEALTQADWSINDETSAAYVKNRTHYIGDLVETELADIAALATANGISFSAQSMTETDVFMASGGPIPILLTSPLVVGDQYTAIIDETEYNYEFQDVSSVMGENNYALGDWDAYMSAVSSGDFSGLNFLMLIVYEGEVDGKSAYEANCIYRSEAAFTEFKLYGLGQEIVKIDEKFLPDSLMNSISGLTTSLNEANTRISSAESSIETNAKTIATNTESINTNAESITSIRTQVEQNTKDIFAAKEYLVLIDVVNGSEYIIQMKNGNLVSFSKATGISVTTMPTKTEYSEGDTFDPTGMVIAATCEDGTVREVENYTYNEVVTGNVVINYEEAGIVYTTSIPLSVTPFDPAVALVDFEYTANSDGTYTLTGWKETLNGETSTEMVIPANGLIVL